MNPLTPNEFSLARILAGALSESRSVQAPRDLAPADRPSAYAVQQKILELISSPVAGWKVGTAPEPAAVLGSPIPERCLHASPVALPLASFPVCGVEIEIAFRFSKSFPRQTSPYPEAEVMGALSEMATSLEIVASRYLGWPDIPETLKLADLQNHGALIVGKAVPYRPDFPYLYPNLQLTLDGNDIGKSPASNPAGDPRRLLPAFINQSAERGLPVQAGQWITTGSYSGIHFIRSPGLIRGSLEGLPGIELKLV